MPSRYRERTQPATYTYSYYGRPPTSSSYTVTTERFSDPLPGPGPCSHSRATTCNVGYKHNATGSYDRWYDHVLWPKSSSIALKGVDQMNWNKLPSSTKAGIIQILAELDNTVGMFAKSFWASLNYGSWTWGVMPFVSDLVAVANAVKNIGTNLSDFDYEDQFTLELPPDDIPTIIYEGKPAKYDGQLWLGGEAKVRYTGKADMSFQHPGSIALDWLGFHPDLATAWELVPFSFVVDYLYPIGDFLEQFRQGGWVKTVYFSGWQTVKITGSVEYHHDFPGYTGYRGVSQYSSFTRYPGGFVLVADSTPDFALEFQIPSFREMFNMLYLLFA